jgi:hypothetical protein
MMSNFQSHSNAGRRLVANPYLSTTRQLSGRDNAISHADDDVPDASRTQSVSSGASITPVNHVNGANSKLSRTSYVTPVTAKRVKAAKCTDLSMNESYDSSLVVLGTTVAPSPSSSSTSVNRTVKAATSAECEDDSPLTCLFGDPTVHGEKEDMGKKKRKQRGGNGPPTGDQPLVSIKWCGNKGLVQTMMLQFLCGRKKTKIVACDNSLSSSLLFSQTWTQR